MSDALEQAREHRASLRAAIGRVERSVAGPGGGRPAPWANELMGALDHLGTALEQHIAVTEAPDALLDDIAASKPELAERVAATKEEHEELRGLLTRARSALDGERTDVVAARERVVDLLTLLVRHRQLGADLVYEAYGIDIEAPS